jgi:hypothetical protein
MKESQDTIDYCTPFRKQSLLKLLAIRPLASKAKQTNILHSQSAHHSPQTEAKEKVFPATNPKPHIKVK